MEHDHEDAREYEYVFNELHSHGRVHFVNRVDVACHPCRQPPDGIPVEERLGKAQYVGEYLRPHPVHYPVAGIVKHVSEEGAQDEYPGETGEYDGRKGDYFPDVFAPQREQVVPVELLERRVADVVDAARLFKEGALLFDDFSRAAAPVLIETGGVNDEVSLFRHGSEFLEVVPVGVADTRHVDEVGICPYGDHQVLVLIPDGFFELPVFLGILETRDTPRRVDIFVHRDLCYIGDRELQNSGQDHEREGGRHQDPVGSREAVKPPEYAYVPGPLPPLRLFAFRYCQRISPRVYAGTVIS